MKYSKHMPGIMDDLMKHMVSKPEGHETVPEPKAVHIEINAIGKPKGESGHMPPEEMSQLDPDQDMGETKESDPLDPISKMKHDNEMKKLHAMKGSM